MSSWVRYHTLVTLPLCIAGLSVFACQRMVSNPRQAFSQQQTEPYRRQQETLLKRPLQNPRIVITKSKRLLELYSQGTLVRSYHVGLGFNPVDDKKVEGDGCTPEGEFYVFTKNTNSKYYLSLGISYPNGKDAERGLREGLISRAEHDAILKALQKKLAPPQNTALGGLIYIHGHGSKSDWTWGCVALENENIDELFNAIERGTPVTIKP